MNYADEKDIGKYDEIVEQDNVKVIIDSKALLSIVGTKMNYTCNTIRSEFIFENPNAKMTCGCGESFMT
jgi:iron-sulfur cluster assembly protein|tara:strand:+ start:223 stop:429 length:207 start_codon:yes stop_codon:yes gene_type:complete